MEQKIYKVPLGQSNPLCMRIQAYIAHYRRPNRMAKDNGNAKKVQHTGLQLAADFIIPV